LDKRPKTIKEMFDQIAPRYDLLNHILSLSVDTLWRRKAIRRLGIKRGDSILDIATGTGDLFMLALKRNRDCRIVGIDISSEMLHIASQKKDRKGYRGRYFLVAGDACSMPFRGYAFDHAMVAFGIRNMSDVEDLFKEVRRILKDGGKFAILEFSIPEVHFIRKIYLIYLKR
jgi:Methylase involved in ubiquinone/menaquinone biosynthesis